MPRPPNPDVRVRLVKAGRDLFLRQGFNGSGVQEIATAAKIPKGSFYSYFPSKEDFAIAVLEEYWAGVEERFGPILRNESLSPVERIIRYFRALSDEKAEDNYANGCLIGSLSLEIANTSAEVRSKLSKIFEQWAEPIIMCLREAQRKREISVSKDLADLAATIIESWEGASLKAKVEQKYWPYRRFEEFILPALLKV
jgi:TetR/AcrR family transcriptional repressor of nem operon